MQTPSFHLATGGFGNLGLVALSLCSCISPLFSIGGQSLAPARTGCKACLILILRFGNEKIHLCFRYLGQFE